MWPPDSHEGWDVLWSSFCGLIMVSGRLESDSTGLQCAAPERSDAHFTQKEQKEPDEIRSHSHSETHLYTVYTTNIKLMLVKSGCGLDKEHLYRETPQIKQEQFDQRRIKILKLLENCGRKSKNPQFKGHAVGFKTIWSVSDRSDR